MPRRDGRLPPGSDQPPGNDEAWKGSPPYPRRQDQVPDLPRPDDGAERGRGTAEGEGRAGERPLLPMSRQGGSCFPQSPRDDVGPRYVPVLPRHDDRPDERGGGPHLVHLEHASDLPAMPRPG